MRWGREGGRENEKGRGVGERERQVKRKKREERAGGHIKGIIIYIYRITYNALYI